MPLLYEKHGAVAVLTLSRPQARNAWGEDYNAALKELLPQIEDDPGIRAVILTGDEAGGAFSAGANIKDPKTHTSDSIADAIEALPKRRRFQAMDRARRIVPPRRAELSAALPRRRQGRHHPQPQTRPAQHRICGGWLGLSAAEIAELKQQGVI